MICGKVTYVDGLNIGLMTDDGVETVVGIDRTNTDVTVRNADQEPKDAKTCKPADIRTGDTVEARGANPARSASVRVIRGTAEDLKAVKEFNARKAAPVTTVDVRATSNKDAPITMPAERLTVADQAPPEVPYGQRRAWREKEAKRVAKERGGDVVKQEANGDEGAADTSDHPNHAQLKEMSKAELEKEAKREGVELPAGGTKDEYLHAFTSHHRAQTRARNRAAK